MGSSYQTVLIAADLPTVRDALPDAGFLLPAARGRTAFMPKEGDYDYADPMVLAERISVALRVPAVANDVYDSDVVTMTAFRDGRVVHRYESADPDSDRGPVGTDARGLAPFGAGRVDLDRLGMALRGEFSGTGRVFAEFQHRLIVKAMNLDPTGLTTAYRWAGDLPGVVRTPVRTERAAAAGGWQDVPVVVLTGLPLDADPDEVAQSLADAVAGGELRADVGVLLVVPGAAGAWDLLRAVQRHQMVPRHGTFFVALQARPGISVRKARKAAERAWEAALRRHGVRAEQGPAFVTVTAHQFEIGYAAAVSYRSSRP